MSRARPIKRLEICPKCAGYMRPGTSIDGDRVPLDGPISGHLGLLRLRGHKFRWRCGPFSLLEEEGDQLLAEDFLGLGF